MLVSKSSIISNARMWTRHELPGEQQLQRSSIAVQCSTHCYLTRLDLRKWFLSSFTFQSLQGVISTQNKKNQSAGYNGAGMVYAYFCKFLQIFTGERCKNSTFFTNSLENLVCQSTFSEEVASTPLPPSKKEGELVRTSPPAATKQHNEHNTTQ